MLKIANILIFTILSGCGSNATFSNSTQNIGTNSRTEPLAVEPAINDTPDAATLSENATVQQGALIMSDSEADLLENSLSENLQISVELQSYQQAIYVSEPENSRGQAITGSLEVTVPLKPTPALALTSFNLTEVDRTRLVVAYHITNEFGNSAIGLIRGSKIKHAEQSVQVPYLGEGNYQLVMIAKGSIEHDEIAMVVEQVPKKIRYKIKKEKMRYEKIFKDEENPIASESRSRKPFIKELLESLRLKKSESPAQEAELPHAEETPLPPEENNEVEIPSLEDETPVIDNPETDDPIEPVDPNNTPPPLPDPEPEPDPYDFTPDPGQFAYNFNHLWEDQLDPSKGMRTLGSESRVLVAGSGDSLGQFISDFDGLPVVIEKIYLNPYGGFREHWSPLTGSQGISSFAQVDFHQYLAVFIELDPNIHPHDPSFSQFLVASYEAGIPLILSGGQLIDFMIASEGEKGAKLKEMICLIGFCGYVEEQDPNFLSSTADSIVKDYINHDFGGRPLFGNLRTYDELAEFSRYTLNPNSHPLIATEDHSSGIAVLHQDGEQMPPTFALSFTSKESDRVVEGTSPKPHVAIIEKLKKRLLQIKNILEEN